MVTESDGVATLVAVPPDSVAATSRLVPSIVNCTVPVGVPEPGELALTVAVKVRGLSKYDGLDDEVTMVVLFAMFTVCERFGEVLPLKLESPLYTAVMV